MSRKHVSAICHLRFEIWRLVDEGTLYLEAAAIPAVTIDGWQQGFLVPAGAATSVELTYQPDSPYRWSLLGGSRLSISPSPALDRVREQARSYSGLVAVVRARGGFVGGRAPDWSAGGTPEPGPPITRR